MLEGHQPRCHPLPPGPQADPAQPADTGRAPASPQRQRAAPTDQHEGPRPHLSAVSAHLPGEARTELGVSSRGTCPAVQHTCLHPLCHPLPTHPPSTSSPGGGECAGRAASLRADLQAAAPLCQLTVRQILHQRPRQAVLGATRAPHPPSKAALTSGISGKGFGTRLEDRVGVGRVTAAGPVQKAEAEGRDHWPPTCNTNCSRKL